MPYRYLQRSLAVRCACPVPSAQSNCGAARPLASSHVGRRSIQRQPNRPRQANCRPLPRSNAVCRKAQPSIREGRRQSSKNRVAAKSLEPVPSRNHRARPSTPRNTNSNPMHSTRAHPPLLEQHPALLLRGTQRDCATGDASSNRRKPATAADPTTERETTRWALLPGAAKLAEGTPARQNLDKGEHRRLQKEDAVLQQHRCRIGYIQAPFASIHEPGEPSATASRSVARARILRRLRLRPLIRST